MDTINCCPCINISSITVIVVYELSNHEHKENNNTISHKKANKKQLLIYKYIRNNNNKYSECLTIEVLTKKQ